MVCNGYTFLLPRLQRQLQSGGRSAPVGSLEEQDKEESDTEEDNSSSSSNAKESSTNAGAGLDAAASRDDGKFSRLAASRKLALPLLKGVPA